MRKTTPPLNALRAFEAAARYQSFARAAEELCVTPGAISQQISALESRLGLALFKRSKQRLAITDAGSCYLIPLKQSLDLIESATVDLLYHGGNGGELRVGVLPSLANFWLIPHLALFKESCPNIKLNLSTLGVNFTSAERSPDLEGGLIDIGLFYGNGHWSRLTSEKILSEFLIPVVAPQFVADRSESNSDLLETLPLLRHSTRPDSWTEWLQHNHLPMLTPDGFSFEHFHMLIHAAKAGLGIALTPRLFVQDELDQGALVEIKGHAVESQNAYYLVYDAAKVEDPKVNKFRSWILSLADDKWEGRAVT